VIFAQAPSRALLRRITLAPILRIGNQSGRHTAAGANRANDGARYRGHAIELRYRISPTGKPA